MAFWMVPSSGPAISIAETKIFWMEVVKTSGLQALDSSSLETMTSIPNLADLLP
jgi:hypothetical protein